LLDDIRHQNFCRCTADISSVMDSSSIDEVNVACFQSHRWLAIDLEHQRAVQHIAQLFARMSVLSRHCARGNSTAATTASRPWALRSCFWSSTRLNTVCCAFRVCIPNKASTVPTTIRAAILNFVFFMVVSSLSYRCCAPERLQNMAAIKSLSRVYIEP